MFSVERPSRTYGDRFTVNAEDVKTLKADPKFMESYRKGIMLVALSWGRDLKTGADCTNDMQKWTGYNVRLGKMLESLTLFDQIDLKQTLVRFVKEKISLESLDRWIQDLCI